jgi:hypothetical protein
MRLSQRQQDPRRRRRWRLGAVIAACVIVVAAGLSLVAVNTHGQAKPHKVTTDPAAVAHVSPPTPVCGNKSVLGAGPATAPAGAITVPAGDDSDVNWSQPKVTYWFAPGLHTLGPGQYTQIDPANGATFIGAPGAVLDGQHTNLYAFAGSAADVRISYLTVQNFGSTGDNQNEGVVNHDSATGWTIDHSTLRDNAGAGTMMGSDGTLSYDCLQDNQQYGFNAYSTAGPAHLVVSHNEIAGNDTYNWEVHQPGCGCSGGGKFWSVNGAVVTDNWVHGNHSVGLWADTNNRGFDFSNNEIDDNYNDGLIYEISYNAQIKNNVFKGNGLGAGPHSQGFPTSAIYISESGSDSRVPGPYGKTFAITGNTFVNNWGGVILWENSNRYCNSPANTSSGACTLVAPSSITTSTCTAAHIAHAPYYADCRWKTQNVTVSHNRFVFDLATVGPACTLKNMCGFQGIFSEYGSYPAWSPYQGTAVEKHIALQQGNHFEDNTYTGPWRFMVLAEGDVVSQSAWRAAPYHQDQGSTFAG